MKRYIYCGKDHIRTTLGTVDITLHPGTTFDVEFKEPNAYFDKLVAKKIIKRVIGNVPAYNEPL